MQGLSGRWEREGHLSGLLLVEIQTWASWEVAKGSQELPCEPESPWLEAEVFTG